MTLVNLISHLKSIQTTEMLLAKILPSVEFGQVDTYLLEDLRAESEVHFFDAETMPPDAEVKINGLNYINLFPLAMLQEMIEEYSENNGPKMTDEEIAKRVIEFRIYDA